jgi:hypothetical protein
MGGGTAWQLGKENEGQEQGRGRELEGRQRNRG